MFSSCINTHHHYKALVLGYCTQHLLLTIAVGKIEAMAACWGSSWIESSRRAGYIPSVRVIWLAACSLESKSTTKAISSSPSEMAFVVVHQSWPPIKKKKEKDRIDTMRESAVHETDVNSPFSCFHIRFYWGGVFDQDKSCIPLLSYVEHCIRCIKQMVQWLTVEG